jgi:uncharacterized protein (DUF885 family)
VPLDRPPFARPPLARSPGVALALLALLAAGAGRASAQGVPRQNGDGAAPRATKAAAEFDGLVRRHLLDRARSSPEWATSVGLHTMDSRLDDRSADAERRGSVRVAGERAALAAIDTARLDERRRIDWLLLDAALATQLRDAGDRGWERRPGGYVPFGAVYSLAVGTTPAPRTRMAALTRRLEQWPAALALGRKQIAPTRTPPLWVELDLASARGIARYLRDELPAVVARNDGDTARFARARDAALRSLESYTAWMADTLRPSATGDWKYGEAAYDWRLRHSKLLDTDAASLVAYGHAVFDSTVAQLEALAREIDSTRTWRQIADSSKGLHPPADSVFAAYSREAARAREFIIAKRLFTVPGGERLEMVLTPPNLRQTYAYGGYSAAAPFEKTQVGRFFVTPVPEGASAEEAESKLRGHNYGWITVVALHEGYPGHHLQHVRAAKQPSALRKVYGSEVFGEGWGLYAEELMYQSGFYPTPLARLTQLRMRLWRAARVIIDPSIHTGRMTFDDAVRFFVDSVGLEKADATAEVNRYTTWPTQAISYIVGMREVEALRDAVKARQGAAFDLARFHDVLLGQGSLPPVLMRRAVMAAMGPVTNE